MKNIHLLPTDKPSRLWINNLLQGKLELSKEILTGSNTAQNIYITSNNDNKITDEGVQHIAGTWVLDTINNKVFKASVNIISGDDVQRIVLTTDQDLIKDGVQAIDDDFLEWFVKNPSCEFVEVVDDWNSPRIDAYEYKIIIPKEEPKQETLEELKKWKEEALIAHEINQKVIEKLIDEKKRMYSEKEVYFILCEHTAELFKGSKLTLTKWFEKFKK